MILHSGSPPHPTVLDKLNYSFIDLVHNSPVIRSRSCDNTVAGRVLGAHTSDHLLEMVVREYIDFPKATCKLLLLHRHPPFAIEMVVVRVYPLITCNQQSFDNWSVLNL